MASLLELACNEVSSVFRLTSLRRLCLCLVTGIEQKCVTMFKQAVILETWSANTIRHGIFRSFWLGYNGIQIICGVYLYGFHV